MNHTITAIITEEGLYSKWVGAELVSAIDSQNPNTVAYVLRNRTTLTTTTMLGKPEDKEVNVYVEALFEEGRAPVAIFSYSKELYKSEEGRTERECLRDLANLIQEYGFELISECDCEDIDEEGPNSSGQNNSSFN